MENKGGIYKMKNELPYELRKANIENILGGNDGGVPVHKAEGSRGGKVIGHTKSGKPIYAVYLKGGTVREWDHKDDSKEHGQFIKHFNSKEEADEYAEKKNKSVDEGMKYHSKPFVEKKETREEREKRLSPY